MLQPAPAGSRPAKLSVQYLEPRMVPALYAQLDAGVLGIWGTDASEDIIVRQIAGRLSVDDADILVNGVPRPDVSVLAVRRIEIACGAGDDTVYLNSQTVAGQQPIKKTAYVWGEAGNDWVEGGEGKDIVDLGTGEDVAFAEQVQRRIGEALRLRRRDIGLGGFVFLACGGERGVVVEMACQRFERSRCRRLAKRYCLGRGVRRQREPRAEPNHRQIVGLAGFGTDKPDELRRDGG